MLGLTLGAVEGASLGVWLGLKDGIRLGLKDGNMLGFALGDEPQSDAQKGPLESGSGSDWYVQPESRNISVA